MLNSEKIRKHILFKIWDVFILILVVVAIGLLIHSYFEITPELQEKYLTYNFIISLIFMLDVVIRCVLFKKEYIFSTQIIIDVLACSDIITPALRALRGIKYTRFIRLLRVLRMLRIFRGIKTIKYTTKSVVEEKIFNTIAIVTIIAFIIIAVITSNFMKSRLIEKISDNYKALVTSTIVSSLDVNGNYNLNIIKKNLNSNNNIIYYSFLLNGMEKPLENESDFATYKKHYFSDDILTVKLNKNNIIKVVVKKEMFYIRLIEFFILILSLPTLIILLSMIHIIVEKYFTQPLTELSEKIAADKKEKIGIDTKLKGSLIYNLIDNYNKSIDNNFLDDGK